MVVILRLNGKEPLLFFFPLNWNIFGFCLQYFSQGDPELCPCRVLWVGWMTSQERILQAAKLTGNFTSR